MSNLLTRALTGLLFVSLIIFSIIYSEWSTLIVFSLFFLLGTHEYFSLFKKNITIEVRWFLPTLFSSLIFYLLVFGIYFKSEFKLVLCIISPLVMLIMLSELWRKKTNPLVNMGVHLLGFVYLIVPFYTLIVIRVEEQNSVCLLVGMFTLIWSNDTFAYLTGRMFGKTKLFERISPKKTWEGTIGGIFLTLGIGVLIAYYDQNQGIVFWGIASLLIAPCAIFGDLLESLFKRSLNIKDSGSILPGHGGILDRFDAALFTIPFFYCWWTIYAYFWQNF